MDEPAGIYISGIDRAGLETRASSRERTRTRVFRSLLKEYAETRGRSAIVRQGAVRYKAQFLESNVVVQAAIKKWWRWLPKIGDAYITRQTYEDLHYRLYEALVTAADFEEHEAELYARRIALADIDKVEAVTYGVFQKAVFDLAFASTAPDYEPLDVLTFLEDTLAKLQLSDLRRLGMLNGAVESLPVPHAQPHARAHRTALKPKASPAPAKLVLGPVHVPAEYAEPSLGSEADLEPVTHVNTKVPRGGAAAMPRQLLLARPSSRSAPHGAAAIGLSLTAKAAVGHDGVWLGETRDALEGRRYHELASPYRQYAKLVRPSVKNVSTFEDYMSRAAYVAELSATTALGGADERSASVDLLRGAAFFRTQGFGGTRGTSDRRRMFATVSPWFIDPRMHLRQYLHG